MKYKIATAHTIAKLELLVNELVEQGYSPLGGINTMKEIDWYMQSMFLTLPTEVKK